MTRPPRFALRVLLPLVLLAPRAVAPAADELPGLKTQVVKLRLARGDRFPHDRDPAIELVQLPPGRITLRGPDGKDHEHAIKPVWIARYETRWDEYNVFWMGLDLTETQYQEQRHRVDGPDGWEATRVRPPYSVPFIDDRRVTGYPADCIHFRGAVKYCAWLSKHTRRKFRLPTEAEWEYACRAGSPPLKPDAAALDRLAWFAGNSSDTPDVPGYEEPHPVGRKRPNAWGLYDMLGNVGEFVIRDPTDQRGLLAGGSCDDDAKDVHSGAREPYSPDWQRNDPEDPKRDPDWTYVNAHHVGFRVVMEE